MKIYLGVTDKGWYDFLSREKPDEVNFWHPGGPSPLQQLQPGAPFLFKLKSPYNHVAGGGYFIKSFGLTLSTAWDYFGRENGVASYDEFRAKIRQLTASGGRHHDPVIGCTILSAPFFWPQQNWIEAPEDWKSNIVKGKYYDTGDVEGRRLWDYIMAMNNPAPVIVEPGAQIPIVPSRMPRYGDPVPIRPRLGQGAFRAFVADAYKRRCAITGETTFPVLEAAHILPYKQDGPHEVSNGLLLRSDFHKLFDRGLVTITPDLTVEVSPDIREEWYNGKAYYRLHGKLMANIPDDPSLRPATHFLEWHNQNLFRG